MSEVRTSRLSGYSFCGLIYIIGTGTGLHAAGYKCCAAEVSMFYAKILFSQTDVLEFVQSCYYS